MLILEILTIWSIIAIVTTLLAGETFRRMGSGAPNRRVAVIARPVRTDLMRRNNNDTRDVR
jgi:hypothetical protein